MTTANRQINITVNSRMARSQIEALDRQLRRLGSGIGSGGAGGGLGGLGNALSQSQMAAARAAAAMDSAARAMAQAANQMGNLGNQANAANGSVGRLSGSMRGLGGALAGVGIVGAIAAFTTLSDTVTGYQARLRLVSATQDEFAQSLTDVQQIAGYTRNGLTQTAALYATLNRNSRALGLSQRQVADATTVFGLSLKLSGADAQGAASAMLQFTQAVNSGRLQGEEFAALSENNSVFLQALARSMGVATGELKKLASEGQITGDVLKKALTDPTILADMKRQFETLPASFGDVWTAVKNGAILAMAELSTGLGVGLNGATLLSIQTTISNALPYIRQFGTAIRDSFAVIAPIVAGAWSVMRPVLVTLGQNVANITRALVVLGAAFVAIKIAGFITGMISLGAATLTAARVFGVAAVAKYNFAAASTAATGAMARFNLVALANPLVAIATAAIAAGTALYLFSDSIIVSEDGIVSLGDVAGGIYDTLNERSQRLAESQSQIGVTANQAADQVVAANTRSAGSYQVTEAIASASFLMVAQRSGQLAEVQAANYTKTERDALMVYASIGRAIDGMFQFAVGVATATATVFRNMANGIGNFFVRAYNFIGSQISSITEWMETKINGFIDGINSALASVSDIIGSYSMSRISVGVDFVPSAGFEIADVGDSYRRGRRTQGNVAEAGMLALGRDDIDFIRSVDRNSRSRAADRNAGQTPLPVGNMKADGGSPSSDAGGSGGAGGRDGANAADAAARQAEQRARELEAFWRTFNQETEAAELTGIALANNNKLLEYKRIIGAENLANDDSSLAAVSARIDLENRQLATARATQSINSDIAAVDAEITDARRRAELIAQQGVERGQEAFDLEKQVAEFTRQAGINGVDLTNEELVARRAILATRRAETNELNRQARELNESVERGRSFALAADERRNPIENATETRTKILEDLENWAAEANAAGVMTAEQIARILEAGTEQAAEDFAKTISDAAKEFRDSLDGLVSGISDLFGERAGNAAGGIADILSSMRSGAWSKENFGQGDYSQSNSPLARITGTLGNLSKGIKGLEGVSAALGKAGAGAEIGSQVAAIGKLFSKKFSTGGAQAGGAIGGMVGGPIGSVVGSVIGGIVGGLLKKAKTGSQAFKVEGGQLVAGNLTGNNAQMKDAAKGAGAGVISGIYSIAEKLGADLNSAFSGQLASIGLRDGKYRVDPTGNGATKTKKGAIDFGKDGEASAIMFVIRDAIKKGILTGLSGFSDRIVKGSTDSNFEQMINLASQYETVLKSLATMTDPIRAGADDITKSLDKMVEMMRFAGATADEVSKVSEYRTKALDAFLKDSLSGIKDYRAQLFGEGSGVTKVNQLAGKQAEYEAFRADIAAGKTNIDQSAFTSLGQEIFALSRDVYGTATNQFQAIRAGLIEDSDKLIDSVTNAFSDTTALAIQEQTAAIVREQAITNDYLRQLVEGSGLGAEQIRAAIAASQSGTVSGGRLISVNGSTNIDLV